MSVCVPCQKTELIPKCLTDLIIGTVSDFNEDMYIYIRDLTTLSLRRFEEQSSGAGLVTLTGLDTEPDFMPSHAYELWITRADATSIEDKEDITINTNVYTCLALRFIDVEDESYASITIEDVT